MTRLRRLILPAAVVAAVLLLHFAWLGLFPERNAVQARFVAVPAAGSWLARYTSTGGYWLGLSYGLSAAFAAVAFRRYREGRTCSAGRFAIGGATVSGVLPFVACFFLGCCGSPMLAVYLNLFGAAFVPLSKPLMFGVTAVSVSLSLWWMNRRRIGDCCGPVGQTTPDGC